MVQLDRPESWLALHGFFVAFLWEMLQMPFYSMDGLSAWRVTVYCGLASLADAGIMVFAYFVASCTAKDRYWLQSSEWPQLVTFLGVGQVVTITLEFIALRSPWGWSYSESMPVLMGIGLIPVLMWILVPLLALALAVRSARKPRIDR
jgi:hypothetical protein